MQRNLKGLLGSDVDNRDDNRTEFVREDEEVGIEWFELRVLLDVFWSGVQVKGLGSGLESLMHLMSGAGCFNGEAHGYSADSRGWMNSRRASVARILGERGRE